MNIAYLNCTQNKCIRYKSHYNDAKLQDISYSKNVLNKKLSSNTCKE